jgi:hypothetical protein
VAGESSGQVIDNHGCMRPQMNLLQHFVELTDGISYNHDYGDPTFDREVFSSQNKVLARRVKKAWNAVADHSFINLITKIHWIHSQRPWEDVSHHIMKSAQLGEISTIGYSPGRQIKSSWGKIGFLIEGITTLACNSMHDMRTGYYADLPLELIEKYKNRGMRRRSTIFNRTKSLRYILDHSTFEQNQINNEFVVASWKPVGVVIIYPKFDELINSSNLSIGNTNRRYFEIATQLKHFHTQYGLKIYNENLFEIKL